MSLCYIDPLPIPFDGETRHQPAAPIPVPPTVSVSGTRPTCRTGIG